MLDSLAIKKLRIGPTPTTISTGHRIFRMPESLFDWMLPEPLHDLIGTFVRREYRVKDVLNMPIPDDYRQTSEEPRTRRFKSGQAQGIAQLEPSVTQYLKRKLKACGHFPLIFRRLSTQAENHGLELPQLLMTISKIAGLRRASARSRNCVPAVG